MASRVVIWEEGRMVFQIAHLVAAFLLVAESGKGEWTLRFFYQAQNFCGKTHPAAEYIDYTWHHLPGKNCAFPKN